MRAQDVAAANRTRKHDFWSNRPEGRAQRDAQPGDLTDNLPSGGHGPSLAFTGKTPVIPAGAPPTFTGKNSIRRVFPADAPKAAQSRAVRHAWASRVNHVLRTTGDLEMARRAGAELVMAALDCDPAVAAQSTNRWARRGEPLPVESSPLTMVARHHSANVDGAGDRFIEAIMNDEIPSRGPAHG
jgi:hypothetical protein